MTASAIRSGRWRRTQNGRIRGVCGDPATYIADGHHRAASAVKVGLKRRAENPGYTGEEPFNFFLSVLFLDEQLMILPYNRVVRDLNGLDEADFLAAAGEHFTVVENGRPLCAGEEGRVRHVPGRELV